MRNFLVKAVTTFFGVGYLPFMPGTFGSATGIILYYLLKSNLYAYLVVVLILLILGLLLGKEAENIFRRKDPPQVVIDEVAGMLISLAFLPSSVMLVVVGFLLFRILDTLKPFPAGRIQDLHGGAGIMADDIVAGLYANIILQVVFRFASLPALAGSH
ncbi:MAG: phosphatidylglycerophosphatase A [Candidatus Omnitrophica bacterium]|nr:phosphatidylglycerophosphatase A [Candidatus Omnitrophota bacterium]